MIAVLVGLVVALGLGITIGATWNAEARATRELEAIIRRNAFSVSRGTWRHRYGAFPRLVKLNDKGSAA